MKLRKTSQFPSKSFGGSFINFLGIMSAFAIAFGGWFLVQRSLDREKESLLEGGGLVALPQTESLEAAVAGESFELRQLTEDELLQIVQSMEHKGEIRPHEPVQGQLTMAQAFDYGRVWLEDYFLPHFCASDSLDGELRVSGYLWSPETAGAGEEPWLSYWTVSFICQDIDASLLISAVSGQILDAEVTCSGPVPYQSGEGFLEALADYAFSFDLGEDCSIVYSEETDSGAKKMPWYWSFGTSGIYAALDAGSTYIVSDAVEDKSTGTVTYTDREYFKVRLYLCLEPQIP